MHKKVLQNYTHTKHSLCLRPGFFFSFLLFLFFRGEEQQRRPFRVDSKRTHVWRMHTRLFVNISHVYVYLRRKYIYTNFDILCARFFFSHINATYIRSYCSTSVTLLMRHHTDTTATTTKQKLTLKKGSSIFWPFFLMCSGSWKTLQCHISWLSSISLLLTWHFSRLFENFFSSFYFCSFHFSYWWREVGKGEKMTYEE